MPMHWSGLYGMPRRVYTYDEGLGWELFNKLSTWGAYIQALAVILGFINVWRSRTHGAVAGNDPWGASTLEWSIPSPAPDYNFARIPRVTSRYPLWDAKSPGLSGHAPNPSAAADIDQGTTIKSAEELGIPMPYPTIKPLWVAFFMTTMFASLLFIHKDMLAVGVVSIILNAMAMVAFLYAWLLSPLEPAHH